MKMMRKISAVIVSLFLLAPCFSMVAFASDGRISFSDPETKVGDEFDVKCAARSSGANMGSIEIQLSYDSAFLRFVSGDGVTQDADGALTLSADGGSAEQIFMVKFQALQEGSTQVTISGATIADANGAALTMDQGSSAITIGEGDPSKIEESSTAAAAEDMQVEVNGVSYTLTDKFTDGDIPGGYERTTVNLDGQDRQMVVNASSGVTLGYLIGEDGTASFFVFNEEDATFSPYAEIAISDMSSIVLMSSSSSQAALPEDYTEATLTLGEYEFPVWQSENDSGFYVLYAINNNGEEGYYRYDPAENTYQRYTPEGSGDGSAADTSTLLGKIQKFLSDNIQKIVLFGGLGALLLLIIFIVLVVKLHNRNVELDEIYEEYGLNDMEELPQTKKEKKQKKDNAPVGRRKGKGGYDDDDDGYDDDGYDDDDFDTDEMDLTDEMDFAADEADFATDEMGFATDDIDFEAEELDFSTADFGFKTEDVSPTEEMDFETSGLSLDGVEEDDKVVYGGKSHTGELTIDDLDDLLNEKKEPSKKEEAFPVDFVDLD